MILHSDLCRSLIYNIMIKISDFSQEKSRTFFLDFPRPRPGAAAARPAGLGSMARGPRWTQSHEPGRGELFPRPRNAVTRDCSASPANTAADDHTFLQASDVQVKIVRTVSKSAGACRGGLAAPGRPGEPRMPVIITMSRSTRH